MNGRVMVESLANGCWRLAGRDEESESLHNLALEVLEKNGKPLRRDLFEMAMRRLRPDIDTIKLRWPLVPLPNRIVALGPRDLRVTREMRRRLRRQVRECRRNNGTPDLLRIWSEEVPEAPALDRSVLAQLAGISPA
jgi:hypothetical protein